MLAIRLSRTGKKHQAYFRIVVSDSHRTPTAKFVEILGNYDPHAKKLQIDKDRLDYYLKNGAQPSNSVAKLLKNEKIDMPKWVKITEKKRAPKKTEEEKTAPKAEAKEGEPDVAEEVTEAEAVEAPAEEKVEESVVKEEEKVEAEVAEEPKKEVTEDTPAESEEKAK